LRSKLPKLIKNYWASPLSVLRNSVKDLISDGRLDLNYLHRISEQIEVLQRRQFKIYIINLIIVAALFVNIFLDQSKLDISGLSIGDIGKLREFLLVTIGGLTLISSLLQVSISQMNTAKKACLKNLFPDEQEQHMHEITLPSIWGPGTTSIMGWGGNRVFSGFGVITFLLVIAPSILALLVLAVSPYVVMGFTVLEVIKSPNLPEPWNYFIIIWVGVAMVGGFLMAISLSLPMHHRDYSLLNELSDLEKRDKKLYDQKLRKIMEEHKKK
tara:strand:- start:65 stop:874 length:810 start_codon:yes stop_codon:yes gene_type:complete